jgi:sialate O-acetylesterase
MVWYQGESNAKDMGRAINYDYSLPKWCKHLRKEWERDDFYLLVVMLPRIGHVASEQRRFSLKEGDPGLDDPTWKYSWAYFREVQANILKLPHTGIVNTIDLGEVGNIHPADKGPVGERIAMLAAGDVNGMKILGDGPAFKGMKINGGEVTISYVNAMGLKTKDGKAPTGFWVAGKERKWAKAEAKIKGENVVLTCAEVAQPEAVRYAFAPAPAVNLVNEADLPARPFRTDRDRQ